jgi:hypothetical protein
MRTVLLAALVAAAVAPAAARADLTLRLDAFDAPPEFTPGAGLELPALALEGVPLGAVDDGGGAPARRGGHRVEPAVALILGIIPGFGLGHFLAGSHDAVYWLIADIIIFFVWPGGFVFTSDRAYAFLGLLVLVERVIEGLSAFQAAGGGPVFRAERDLFASAPPTSPAELAVPIGARAGALAFR